MFPDLLTNQLAAAGFPGALRVALRGEIAAAARVKHDAYLPPVLLSPPPPPSGDTIVLLDLSDPDLTGFNFFFGAT